MNVMERLVYNVPKNDNTCSERFFLIYTSHAFCTDIEISKQGFIEFVNEISNMYEIVKMSSIGRCTYCYCPESGGAIPFAYRCMRD